MPEQKPVRGYGHTLRVVEIVCRMIGFAQDANDMHFEEVLDEWVEQAEEACDDAQRKGLSAEELEELTAKQEHRETIRDEAMEMYAELNIAADKIAQGFNHPSLELCQRKYAQGFVEFYKPSVFIWAKESRGKYIPEWAPSSRGAIDRNSSDTPVPLQTPTTSWVGVTLSFLAKNKLKIVFAEGGSKTQNLESTGLINQSTKGLNTAGTALLGLASNGSIMRKSGPAGTGVSKKIMSELRSTLKKMFNIDTDPFYDYNKANGWKPRFQVLDRRNAGDKWAEKKARHFSYEEGRHGATAPEEYTFKSEDSVDAASKFLEDHDM